MSHWPSQTILPREVKLPVYILTVLEISPSELLMRCYTKPPSAERALSRQSDLSLILTAAYLLKAKT